MRSTLTSKAKAGTDIGVSTLLLLPTLGVSGVGLAYIRRTVDIARRKVKVAKVEIKRRTTLGGFLAPPCAISSEKTSP